MVLATARKLQPWINCLARTWWQSLDFLDFPPVKPRCLISWLTLKERKHFYVVDWRQFHSFGQTIQFRLKWNTKSFGKGWPHQCLCDGCKCPQYVHRISLGFPVSEPSALFKVLGWFRGRPFNQRKTSSKSSLPLPTSAASSVHIVRSLTSKLPSVIWHKYN